MKGLIIKDLIALKKQGKIMLLLAAFYIVYSISTKNISMLGVMVAVFCVMLPISSMAYDEYCKWDRYALSMPISGKTIVLSKYVLGILLDLVGIVIIAPTSAVIVKFSGEMSIGRSLLVSFAIGEIALVFLSIILPIFFKFGVEKGRMLMITVILAPTVLAFLVKRLNIKLPSEHNLELLAYISPIITVAVFLLSVYISIKIYSKKEF